jgi:hypothetical protein
MVNYLITMSYFIESDLLLLIAAATVINSRCTGATAIGLAVSVIVFTMSSIITILVKANKKARRVDLATRRTAQVRLSRNEEQDPGQQPLTRKVTAAPESICTTNATIYDDDDTDYERVKVAVIPTDENIAYGNPAREQTETNTNEEQVYAQIR